MDSIYNAANSASRVIFGDTPTDSLGRPIQNQNENQNRTGAPSSNIDSSSTTETNPFRGTTTDNDTNPFRHATDSTSYSSGNALGGSGSQHTAGSGHTELNKPNFESGSTGLQKPSGGGSTYDAPSSTDFSKHSIPGAFGSHTPTQEWGGSGFDSTHHTAAFEASKPTTTTSTFGKNSIGDFNKDGNRHQTSDINNPSSKSFGSENRPTISDVTDVAGTSGPHSHAASGLTVGDEKPLTSRFSEGTSNNSPLGGSGVRSSTSKYDQDSNNTSTGVGGLHQPITTRKYDQDNNNTSTGVGGLHQPITTRKYDQDNNNTNTGVGGLHQPITTRKYDQDNNNNSIGAGSLHKPSTTSYGTHEHNADPTDSNRSTTDSSNERSKGTYRAGDVGGFTSGVAAEHNRRSDTDFNKSASNPLTSTSTHHPNRDTTSASNPNPNRDTTHEQTPRQEFGAPAQGFNIKPHNDTSNPTTGGFSSSDKPSSSNAPNAGAHAATSSGVETANAAPKSLVTGADNGPGTAVETSTGADPTSGQKPTPKQQGADRPTEDPDNQAGGKSNQPDAHKPRPLGQEDNKESKGTGEKYEKSTGMAAEGGDFDARRPGAGREAE